MKGLLLMTVLVVVLAPFWAVILLGLGLALLIALGLALAPLLWGLAKLGR